MEEGFCPVAMEVWSSSASEEDEDKSSASQGEEEEEEVVVVERNENAEGLCRELMQGEGAREETGG